MGLHKINFSITQLEYVWAVYKQGHFAKAAETCGITQPTLSMQIQKLEEDLGIVIFDRTKKPILLTEAGKKIIEQIQVVLAEAKKIEGIVHANADNQLQGELTLGIIPTLAPYVLPLLLPTMKRQLPELKLKILEMQTHQIIDALNSDELDVGMLATPLKISKIIEYPLYYEPFYVLCKKDHPLSRFKKIKYTSLSFDDIWLLEEGHCLRNQVLDICSLKKTQQKDRQFLFESGSIETLKNLVNAYGGYTLVPHLANNNTGKDTLLIPFERPIPSREIGLVYQRAQYKTNLIEALGQAIIDSLPEEVRKIRRKDLEVIGI